jgi:hypothetical protein
MKSILYPMTNLFGLAAAVIFFSRGTGAQPILRAERAPNHNIHVTWDGNLSGYQLEEASSIAPGAAWMPAGGTPNVEGGEVGLTLPIGDSTHFFRLHLAGAALQIADTSPADGESGVAVTRETIFRFSEPLAPDAILTPESFFAEFGGRHLLTRPELSEDRKTATLFYTENLPASARVRVTLNGDSIRDAAGKALDGDGDGAPGGMAVINFDTFNSSTLPNTAVIGHVYAAELVQDPSTGQMTNLPLSGVTITVDGAEETVRTTTDTNGFFRLQPAPAGRFFVHVDGRTAEGSHWPGGAYYPFVGKAWDAVAGRTNNLAAGSGEIFLPLIPADSLTPVNANQATTITFPASLVANDPAYAGIEITIPPNALYGDNGTRGGKIGMAPVPPDRLPEPLPEGLHPALVITVQTDGPMNFGEPVAVKFPNLPDPVTGEKLPPGAKTALWSFNHDTGRWEMQGPATVTPDGNFVVSDAGVGIRQPGWNMVTPGTSGFGPDSSGSGTNCDGLFSECDPYEACKNKKKMMYNALYDTIEDIFIGAITSETSPIFQCALGGGISSIRAARDCSLDPAGCLDTKESAAIGTGLGCIPEVGNVLSVGWDGKGIIDGYFNYIDCFDDHLPHIRAQALSGPDSQLQSVAGYFDDQLRYSGALSNSVIALFGSPVWERADVVVDPAYKTLFESIASAVDPASPGGSSITSTERNAILAQALPGAASLQDASALVDRFGEFSSGAFTPGSSDGAAFVAAANEALSVYDEMVLKDWQTSYDGLFSGAVLLCKLNAPRISSEFFPARAHHYLLLDLQTGFSMRGRLSSEGRFPPVILAPNHFYIVAYFDDVTKRTGAAVFRTAQSGLVTSIPTAPLEDRAFADQDGDGLNDLAESILGTRLNAQDSDGDGQSDAQEIGAGSDPLDRQPVVLGTVASITSTTPITELAIAGDLLLAAGEQNGFTVYDVKDPLHPLVLSQAPYSAGKIIAVSASDNTAALLDDQHNASLLDLAQGTNVHVINTQLLAAATAIATGDGRVYAATPAKIIVLDGETGETLSTLNGDWEGGLQFRDGLLYALSPAGANSQLGIFDASADALTLLSQISAGSSNQAPLERQRALFAAGGSVYIGDGGGYAIFDVSDPVHPHQASQPGSPLPLIHAVVPTGSGILLAATSFAGQSTLQVSAYDISNPSNTSSLLAVFDTPGDPRSLVVQRGYALVADTSGLTTVNYLAPDTGTNPPSITLRTQSNASAEVSGERFAVFADAADDVQVREVEFYIDGVLAAADGSFPFETHLQTPLLTSSKTNFVLQAKARDTGGNFAWSATQVIQIAAATEPPEIAAITTQPRLPLPANQPIDIAVRFKKPISPASVTSQTCQLIGTNGLPIAGGVILVTNNSRTILLAFPSGVPAGTNTLVLKAGITSLAGVHLATDFSMAIEVIGPKTWNSDSDGNWGDPSNWIPAGAPTTNDFVIIDRPNADPLIHFDPANHSLVCRNLLCREDADYANAFGGFLTVEENAEFDGAVALAPGVASIRGGHSIFNGVLSNASNLLLKQHSMELRPSSSPHLFDNGSAQLSVADPSADLAASALKIFPGSILEFHSTDTNQSFPRLHVSGESIVFEDLAPSFVNNGELRKTGPGVAAIDTVLFQNTGLVDVREGMLELGQLTVTFKHDGQYQIASGATLRLLGQNHLFGHLASVTGTGTFDMNGAALFLGDYNFAGLTRIGQNVEFAGLVHSGGDWSIRSRATLSGLSANFDGTVTMVGGTLTCNAPETTIANLVLGRDTAILWGGSFDGSGKLRILGSLSITNPLSISRTSHFPLAVTFEGPVEVDSDFTMQSTRDAVFNAPVVWNSGIISSYIGGSPRISPTGSFEIATNGLWTRTDIINEGTVAKTSTGDAVLRSDATFGAFRNFGLLTVSAGRLALDSGFYIQSSGETRLAGGDLVFTRSLLNSDPFQFTGGKLTGSGILGGGINLSGSAEVSPGYPDGAAGTLTITNTFSTVGIDLFFGTNNLDTNMQFTVDIGGPVPGTDFDQLIVYGRVFAQGTLNARVASGFVPEIGSTFQILKCTTLDDEGKFVFTPPQIGPGKAFKVNYITSGPNQGVALEVISSP